MQSILLHLLLVFLHIFQELPLSVHTAGKLINSASAQDMQ